MSVYIKGVSMPTGAAEELRLFVRANGQVIVDKRTHWEGAEAIPVSPHGRLIDADALKLDLTRFYDGEVTAKRLIDEQPTIIPAEEGEG